MSDESDTLATRLSIEPVRDGEFVARLESFEGYSFGGETLACAATAAARSCQNRELHALHACFLRRVPPEVPIRLSVESVRDGRRISHRRVRVMHDERILCDVTASFAAESGVSTPPTSRLDPSIPPPESVPGDVEVARAEGWDEWQPGPVEWRIVGSPWRPVVPGEPSDWGAWVRPRVPLPDDSTVHTAALVFLSDYLGDWSIAREVGEGYSRARFASLDHAMWFRRPAAFDDWMWITTRSDGGPGGRWLTWREIFTREGAIVASIAQESLVAPAP